MCDLNPGSYYYIVNAASGLSDPKLAVAWDGVIGTALTANVLNTSNPHQVWNIFEAGNKWMAISPLDHSPEIQVLLGGNGHLTTTTVSEYWYTWLILDRLGTDTCTIEDDKLFWHLEELAPGSQLTYEREAPGDQTQSWWLYSDSQLKDLVGRNEA